MRRFIGNLVHINGQFTELDLLATYRPAI